MSTARAARGLLALAIVLVVALPAMPGALAQGPPDVTLTLLAQTPWNTLQHPELHVTVRAANTGDAPITDLTLGVTLGADILSRTAYETSLAAGPGLPIFATTIAENGTLPAGAQRRFRASVDLGTIGGVTTTDSLIYPMRIDLRSDGTPVAVVDTPVIFLVRQPEKPLLVSVSVELTAPIAFDPEGRLADPTLETAIAPGGTLAGEVSALARLVDQGATPIDLAVEPALLDQLQRMADGYQRADGTTVASGTGGAAHAASLLASLRRVVGSPAIHVTAMPFSAPTVPSLLASGLTSDLAAQEASGRDTVKAVLGVDPASTVTRPPLGALDDAAVQALVALGTSTILANGDTVPRPPQPNEFAAPPTASLAVAGRTVALVLPDTGTQNLMASPGFMDDPVRAAQATMGELAVIWREQPVPPEPRGVAVSLPAGSPAAFWIAFLDRLAGAPFFAPTAAVDLVQQIPPPAAPSALSQPAVGRFTRDYAEAIKSERRSILALQSMLVRPSPVPDRLSRDLLYAESAQYLGNEDAGRAWIDQVSHSTNAVFERAVPDLSRVFTFTSETGTIPLLMGNPDDVPLRFQVQLRSNRFLFPDGDQQTVTLTQPNQVVTFRVTAKTTGRSPIQVVVRAPSGRPIRQATLIVRSTAVNHIALLVTIAAALVLLALWSRRFLRRPTS